MRNIEEIRIQVENSLLKKPDLNNLLEKLSFCEGKLYKYYSFDEYSVQNLKDGILYCSSPRIFNDPFDCNFNFDLNRFLLDIFPFLCKERGINDNDVNLLMNIFKNISLIKKIPKSIFNELIKSLLTIVQDKGAEKVIVDIFDSIYESETLLDFLANLSKTIGNTAIDLDAFIQEKNSALEIGKNLIDERLRICCLTESPKNILMWSHYSQKHTGFCVEYNILQSLDIIAKIFPVIYSENRSSITLDFFDLSDINNIRISESTESTIQLFLFFLTKCKIWEYEQEWRYITFSDLTENNKVKAPPVTKIYLGANIESKNKEIILDYAKNECITVEQMKVNNDKFLLESFTI
jgi:hypothetical protein